MNETGEMFTDAEHNFFAGSGVNLQKTFGWLQARAFRALNTALSHLPGGRFRAFGSGPGQIGKILVINLERQPSRLRRTLRELNRFGTASGVSLISITTRLVAVDARDGRAVASTADVDPAYVLGDQIFVQPDERLENCFGVDEPVTMTRQEVAVARSHIEAWKAVAEGTVEYVLILEDDIWFRPRARSAIDRGWVAAKNRFPDEEGPEFLYLSYSDAGGTQTGKIFARTSSGQNVAYGSFQVTSFRVEQRTSSSARCQSRGRSICGSTDASMRFVRWHSLRLRSFRGGTAAQTTAIPSCPI